MPRIPSRPPLDLSGKWTVVELPSMSDDYLDLSPNPPCVARGEALTDTYAARSRHPGGVYVAMADGSVRFVKDSIQIATWRSLSTTRGGEIVDGESY